MAEFDRGYVPAARGRAGAGVETLDQGLRAFMLGIYNNMAIGLAVTGAVAYGAPLATLPRRNHSPHGVFHRTPRGEFPCFPIPSKSCW